MSDNSFTIKTVDESCAGLVPALFQAIYGNDFPVQYVYHADQILAEIQAGRLASALALDKDNRGIGYVAIYKNTPNPKLWEGGNLLVLPDYGDVDPAWALVTHYLQSENIPTSGSDGMFTESVCHHYFTQLGCVKSGFTDCALMLDQMNADSFKEHAPDTSRVACLMQFFEQSDPQMPCYLPERYFDFLQGLMCRLRYRTLLVGSEPLSMEGVTEYSDSWFSDSGMWRLSVSSIGSDWSLFLENLLQQAAQRNVTSLQVVISADLPYCGAAVEVMRRHGFFLGGIFPRWFDADGILMQLVIGKQPDWDGIKVYSKTARELLAFIRNDQQQLIDSVI